MNRIPIRSPRTFATRLTVTIIAFAILALVPLVLAAPASVMAPLGTVLGLGLLVSGAVMLADRRRSRVFVTNPYGGRS
jgi:hypothetical protein